MASSRVDRLYLLFALVVVMIMLWDGAQAQSGSCTNALVGLSPCLSYVSRNTSTPSPACCLQLSNVVQTTPQCLCTLLNNNGGGALGNININQTQALALPTACNIQTPPLSQCNAASNIPPVGSPVASPEPAAAAPTEASQNNPPIDDSPATASPMAPTSTPKPPSGSKTVPASSDGIMRKPFHVAALIFFITALASNAIA